MSVSYFLSINNEVLLVIGLLLALALTYLAWISTATRLSCDRAVVVFMETNSDNEENRHMIDVPVSHSCLRSDGFSAEPMNETIAGAIDDMVDNSVLRFSDLTDMDDCTILCERGTDVGENATEEKSLNVKVECVGDMKSSIEPRSSSSISPVPARHIYVNILYVNDEQKTVKVEETENVSRFKAISFAEELSQNKRVRLLFSGRELKGDDDATLASYGVKNNSTIHCLVTPGGEEVNGSGSAESNTKVANDSSNSQSSFDISDFMDSCFIFILLALWYTRISYRQYYNVLSTFALTVITMMYVILVFTRYASRQSVTNNNYNTNASGTIHSNHDRRYRYIRRALIHSDRNIFFDNSNAMVLNSF